MQFPFLHAAPHASEPDVWPFFAAAALALVAALIALSRRRAARRLAPTLAFALFVTAAFTTILPVDHLLSSEEPASKEVHAVHCHDAPGSCSQLPVSSGPGQFLLSEPLLVAPAMFSVLLAAAMLSLSGTFRKPDIRPPLLLAPGI